MKTRTKFAVVTVVVGALAFVFAPNGPLGGLLWPEPAGFATAPTGVQELLFVVLGLVTALAFGAGVAYLIYGWSYVDDVLGPDRSRLAVAFHVSVFWLLWSWWLHENLHVVMGMEVWPLLAIEYGFHVTMIAAAGVVAYTALVLARDGARGQEAAGT